MKKALLDTVVLCFAMLSVVALSSCGGGGNGNPNGTSGSSGGGTTGSSGATPENALLKGQYAFSLTGTATLAGAPIFTAGSFTADGAGNITAGVEDSNQMNPSGGVPTLSRGVVVSGTYTVGSDGRGTLNFTKGVTQTFKFVIENNSQGQLIRFDSGATASGIFVLQSASAFSLSSLQGGYTFNWNGYDSGFNPFSGIGTFTLSSGSATAGAADVDDAGSYTQAAASGSLTPPDANGHGTVSITYGSGTASSYGYDIVSASRILLVEMDLNAGTIGEVDLQSQALTASSFSGNYAFFLNGINQGVALAGQISANGGSVTSSSASENALFTLASGTFPAAYTFAPSIGSATVNGRFTMTATEPSGFTDEFVVYLVSPTQAFVMETDPDQITFGQFVAQTGTSFTSASLGGNYGINFTGLDSNGAEVDVVGQITASGTSTLTSGTMIDINDQDLSPTTVPNNEISGGNYTVTNTASPPSTLNFMADGASLTFAFYFASPNQVFMVEQDTQFVSIGSAFSQPTIP